MATTETFTGVHKYYTGFYPGQEPETLSANGAINTTSFLTEISGNVNMTLADGEPNQLKFLNTQGGATATITCSLDQSVDAYVSFDLGANNKALLIFDSNGGFWSILESKPVPLTKNL